MQRKFAIGHELGHDVYMLYRAEHMNDQFYPFDCSANTGGAACEYADGPPALTHALYSMEWSTCAMGEGFAHFFATDVFNSHSQSDARFGYYKYLDQANPYVVDVENGPLGGATAYMENDCTPLPGGGYEGYGTELDWLRTFWDYHTNAGTKPGHSLLLEEMRQAHVDMQADEACAKMRDAATNDGLDSRWEFLAGYNGIDWSCG